MHFDPLQRYALIFGRKLFSSAESIYAVRLSEVDSMTGEYKSLGFDWHDKYQIRRYKDDREHDGTDAKVEVCDLKKRRFYRRREGQSK